MLCYGMFAICYVVVLCYVMLCYIALCCVMTVMLVISLHVVDETDTDSKEHLSHSHYHGHLHFKRVQPSDTVLSQLPNLQSQSDSFKIR